MLMFHSVPFCAIFSDPFSFMQKLREEMTFPSWNKLDSFTDDLSLNFLRLKTLGLKQLATFFFPVLDQEMERENEHTEYVSKHT